jgi:tRNA pseudouridine38-40 synthase
MNAQATTVRLKITLAYQGGGFEGWQLQAGQRPARTVQGCLEQALAVLAGVPVRAHGSARTDAGVHALEQVVHADVPAERAHLPWQRALCALVPRDMAVLEAILAPPGFHARYDALGKLYAYTLWLEPRYVLPQRRQFVWQTGPLDVSAMALAASSLTGRRDFAAFANAGSNVKGTVRDLRAIRTRPGQYPQELVVEFEADGFLKQMVRNLVGTLVAVGRGKVKPDIVRSLTETRDRTRLPATAPARGLCLERVFYGDSGGGRNDSDNPERDGGGHAGRHAAERERGGRRLDGSGPDRDGRE